MIDAHAQRLAQYHDRVLPRSLQGGFERPYTNIGRYSATTTSAEQANAALLASVVELAGAGPGDIVLDAGCSYGRGTAELVTQWGCDRAVGIEIAPGVCEFASESLRREGLDDVVEVRHMSALDMTFADGEFTKVISVDGAFQFASRAKFFGEAYRVLRPGGVLVLADVVTGKAKVSRVEEMLVRWCQSYWHVPPANRYGLDRYAELLKECGFAGVKVESIGADVFGGAAEFMRVPANARNQRAAHGLVPSLVYGLMLKTLAWMYRREVIDYVLVRAERPATPGAEQEPKS
jgi:cyclopropane fatty-acyl-phospholipid synthase-like methyltransferase